MGTKREFGDSSVVEALWPGASLERRAHTGVSYAAVPSLSDPRFLLPRDRRSALAVLRGFRSPGDAAAGRRDALLRTLVATTSGRPFLPSLHVTPAGLETVEGWVARSLRQPTTLGIHLGPRRANRKAIIQVLDEQDRPRAVGKVATSPLTAALVRAEARALDTLTRARLIGIRVPELVVEGDVSGAPAILMSHLPLHRAQAAVPPDRRQAAMVAVSHCLGTRWSLPSDSGCVGRMHAAATTIAEPGVRSGCLRILDVLAAGTVPWELGSWHGDWTDWNMALLDDEVLVWDWERFDPDVPLGWDALHDAVRRDISRRGPIAGVSRSLIDEAPGLLRPFGVDPSIAPYVAAAYLVELAVRYSVDGQRRAGGRSAYVEDWILPVLESWREEARR